MDLTVRVKTTGPLWQPQLASAQVRSQVAQLLTAAALEVQRTVRLRSPVGATGYLRRSWSIQPAAPTRLVSSVYTNVEYALPVELGRRAEWVPIAPLELWVRRKLGISEPAATSVAWAISTKKSRTPTPGQFFFQRSLQETLPRIQRQLFDSLGLAVVSTLR